MTKLTCGSRSSCLPCLGLARGIGRNNESAWYWEEVVAMGTGIASSGLVSSSDIKWTDRRSFEFGVGVLMSKLSS